MGNLWAGMQMANFSEQVDEPMEARPAMKSKAKGAAASDKQ